MVSSLRCGTGCQGLPIIVGVGMGCLILKGYALCVSLNMQMNGTHLLECSALTHLRDISFLVHTFPSGRFLWQHDMLQVVQFVIECLNSLLLHSDHFTKTVKFRALSGCCVATSLVACPGSPLPGN